MELGDDGQDVGPEMAKQLTDPGEIRTTAELEEATDRLIAELTHIANQAVPTRKPNRGSHAP